MKLLQSERQRETRRGFTIRAYTGANGGGKTTCAVWDLLPSLDAGRPVLSTARLLDFRNPRPCELVACEWPGHPEHGHPHPAWVPFTDWRQFLDSDLRDADLLLDEVAGVASSRESGSLPFQVARELQKMRKRGLTLSYTGPTFQRVEKILREVTQLLTHCEGRFGKVVRDDSGVRAWRQNRMLVWRSYDAQEFEKFTSKERQDGEDRKGHVRVVERQAFVLRGSLVTGAFDTMDEVLSLGWANEAGICLECGGRRTVPTCKCGTVRARGRADGVDGEGVRQRSAEPSPAPGRHLHDVTHIPEHYEGPDHCEACAEHTRRLDRWAAESRRAR